MKSQTQLERDDFCNNPIEACRLNALCSSCFSSLLRVRPFRFAEIHRNTSSLWWKTQCNTRSYSQLLRISQVLSSEFNKNTLRILLKINLHHHCTFLRLSLWVYLSTPCFDFRIPARSSRNTTLCSTGGASVSLLSIDLRITVCKVDADYNICVSFKSFTLNVL